MWRSYNECLCLQINKTKLCSLFTLVTQLRLVMCSLWLYDSKILLDWKKCNVTFVQRNKIYKKKKVGARKTFQQERAAQVFFLPPGQQSKPFENISQIFPFSIFLNLSSKSHILSFIFQEGNGNFYAAFLALLCTVRQRRVEIFTWLSCVNVEQGPSEKKSLFWFVPGLLEAGGWWGFVSKGR